MTIAIVILEMKIAESIVKTQNKEKEISRRTKERRKEESFLDGKILHRSDKKFLHFTKNYDIYITISYPKR